MKPSIVLALGAIVLLGGTLLIKVARAEEAPERDRTAMTRIVKRTLDAQAKAWNAGDIDAFMEHYWKSEQLTFSSGGATTRGWEATRANYRRRYPTPEKMGQLNFDHIEVFPLGESAALVLGQWHLKRRKDALDGNFSLVFRHVKNRWVIIHDHTSRIDRDD